MRGTVTSVPALALAFADFPPDGVIAKALEELGGA